MTATKTRPVQATAPERIYLQGGPQLPPETDFSALSEVTWCRDDVDGAGIPYVRADLAGAAPAAVTPQGEWRIDTSTGRGILVYKNCSVIEAEQAPYVLGLIAADAAAAQAPALEAPAAPAGALKREAELLATILRSLAPEGYVPEGVDIYAPDFAPSDGDVFVRRAAQVLEALAAAPQAPAAPSDAQLLSEWDRVSGLTKATERRLACMRAVLKRWGSAAPAAPVPMAWPVARDELQRWAQFADCACRISNPADMRNNMETLAEELTKLSALAPVAAPAAPAVDASDPALPSWWPDFIQCVAELPDRNSPEDEPDAMIATAEELGACAIAAQAKDGGEA